MDNILNEIRSGFNNQVKFQERRPGIYQIYLPIFHEDGDMVDLFLQKGQDGYKLADFGHTLMRLAYTYNIDSDAKEAILSKIVAENGMTEEEGNILMPTNSKTIFTDLMHVAQTYAKIGSMRYFKREVVENLFYEMLDEFVSKELKEFNPIKKAHPITQRPDLEVDYQFTPNGHPVFLFGVKDTAKARLASLSFLEFQRSNLNYRGLVVHEDFDKISKNDRSRLTNTCDKQFTSFDEFKSSARLYLERERLN